MSSDLSPLKYMGTQSQESVNMAEALAKDTASSTFRPAHPTMAEPDAIDEASSSVAAASSKLSDAASWAAGKAKATLDATAKQARRRAATAVTTYTQEDPIRAIMIAASAGALLMGLVAVMARSGARAVQRQVQR